MDVDANEARMRKTIQLLRGFCFISNRFHFSEDHYKIIPPRLRALLIWNQ